jgi:hypothetical protein
MEGDNQGVLFKNEKKREGKRDSDYQGQITIDGKEYWLNAWINTSKDGNKKYMGLKVRLKEAKPQESAATGAIVDEVQKQFPGAKVVSPGMLDDEIPFIWLLPLAFTALSLLQVPGVV